MGRHWPPIGVAKRMEHFGNPPHLNREGDPYPLVGEIIKTEW